MRGNILKAKIGLKPNYQLNLLAADCFAKANAKWRRETKGNIKPLDLCDCNKWVKHGGPRLLISKWPSSSV